MSNLGEVLRQVVCIPTNIPDDWSFHRLTEVCDPKQWRTISASEMKRSGYPVFGANGFVGFYSEYNHSDETIAITCRGNTCGTVNRIPPKTYITGNSMCLDNVQRDFISQDFLFHALRYRGVSDSISGSAQPQITGAGLRGIEFPAPPLPEQQKIAAILSSVDDVIEKTRAQIDRLKDLKTGMMQELLTKGIGPGGVPHTAFKDSPVGRIPEDWEALPLERVVGAIIDCEHKTAPYVERSEYLVVRTSNVRNGQLVRDDMKFTTKVGFDEWTKRAVPLVGDILFTREAPAGESCMVPKNTKVCMGQRMVLLRPNLTKVHPPFLSLYLTSEHAKLKIYELSIGTTVTRINIEDIKRILCVVPSIEEQKAIYSRIQSVQSLVAAQEEQKKGLVSMKKALMQDLLTGKVRVKVS